MDAQSASPDEAGALDAGVPQPDAAPSCTTDDIDLLVGNSAGPYTLEVFHPSTGQTTQLGALDCNPLPNGSGPINALAVSRDGNLYVAYSWDYVYPVQPTATGFACQGPGFGQLSTSQAFLQPLGITFAARPFQPESFYGAFFVAPLTDASGDFLGTLDPQAGTVSLTGTTVGCSGAMTGTSDGRMFCNAGLSIFQVALNGGNAPTWNLLTALDAIGIYPQAPAGGYPFAFWAGDFYLFVAGKAVRFRPSDDTAAVVAPLPTADEVLAAAVSTCAPLH